jgi:flagellar biosynthesis protein FlhA
VAASTGTLVAAIHPTQMDILRKSFEQSDLMVAAGVIGLIAMMIIPVPQIVLDMMITLNFALALCILLVAMYVEKPLDFSIFPPLLLIGTLFRLALNISSTRLILLYAEAGQVIEAFGHFVVGGDLVVGLIIFLILIIIQFVVITSGSQRVAEVAARFTLDEMPGKQMSIDADLNAGLINEVDARERRKHIEREADFYGAMDGASKFVRGDAIAAIIIVVVNIIGGLAIGVLRHHLAAAEALQRYALLTVGDGLVSQIPALLISTATGIVVTRAASEDHLGKEVMTQIFAQPRALMIVAVMLLFFGLVPGLPKFSFLGAAVVAGSISWIVSHRAPRVEQEPDELSEPPPEDALDEILHIDRLSLDIGYNLVGLVGSGEKFQVSPQAVSTPDDLLERIAGVRKQLGRDMGIVMPAVRIRDDMSMPPNAYVIKLKGAEVGRGEVYPGLLLAMASDPTAEPIGGRDTREPVFGLSAKWIELDNRAVAEARGYTVVEPATVIATHFAEIVKSKAAEILNRQDVQALIERVRTTQPAVVTELIPEMASVGQIQAVLRSLLTERVPIRDMPTILEALADALRVTEDIEEATEIVRLALARFINEQYRDQNEPLHVITVHPEVESQIAENTARTLQGSVCAVEPGLMQQMIRSAKEAIEHTIAHGYEPVILTSPGVRRHLRSLLGRYFPAVPVLSHAEIVPEIEVQAAGMIQLPGPTLVEAGAQSVPDAGSTLSAA